MSRLFEALKTASKLNESADAGAGDNVWKALGVEGKAEIAAPISPHTSSAVLTDPLEVDLTAPAPAPASKVAGIFQKTVLDRRARLIPHIADAGVVERYRMLRVKIMQERERAPFRSLLVASPNPQEGKTVTVLNLALSFATLPTFKVLVVDGDMRRGTLGSWLGVDDNRAGLSNLIDGSATLEDVVLESPDLPMHFILRGNSQAHDLESSHYAASFQKMAELYDLVLVDSPPVNVITDAQLLAANCDAVLLVARAFSTTRKALEHAVQNLQSFRMIGTILNAGEATSPHRYNGYYY